MGIVVVRSPKCLRGLLRRLFGLKKKQVYISAPGHKVSQSRGRIRAGLTLEKGEDDNHGTGI